MIRDHVKARITAVKAGHMPKVTLEEYETLRMSTEERRAIASILADDALKWAIDHTVSNCSSHSQTYEDALHTVYLPILMERVFGPTAKEEVEAPPLVHNTMSVWDICQTNPTVGQIVSAKEAWDTCKSNPKARFEALLYNKPNDEYPYYVIGGLHPKTKQFCLLNDPPSSRTSNCFATTISESWTFRRLPDAP